MASKRFADAVTLDQLEIFVEVVDAGSFTAAAATLRRAQSAISYGIARLERQLGVKLLERSLSGARPTPQGRSLLAEARDVVAHAERFRAAGRAFGEEIEPEVSLSYSPIYPIDALTEVMGAMRDRFPHTAVRLQGGNLGATVTDVTHGRTTLGITGLELPPTMVTHLAKPVEMTRVVGRSHVLAKTRGRVPAAELRKHLQLVAMDASEMADKLSLNVLSPRVWRVVDTMVRYNLTLAGVGWTHFVRQWVAADVAAGRLVELRFGKNEVPPRYTPRLFYRADAPPGPAGRWLVERLCEASPSEIPRPKRRARAARSASGRVVR